LAKKAGRPKGSPNLTPEQREEQKQIKKAAGPLKLTKEELQMLGDNYTE
jgi:hypothetical protein